MLWILVTFTNIQAHIYVVLICQIRCENKSLSRLIPRHGRENYWKSGVRIPTTEGQPYNTKIKSKPKWTNSWLVMIITIFFYLTFTDVHTDRQKLGTILEDKVVQKLKFSKNDNKKTLLLNWYSSMKIFFRKIRTFFEVENWLWKSDLGSFWRPVWTSVKVKSKKYFYFTDFFTKMKPLLTHVGKTPPLRSHSWTMG